MWSKYPFAAMSSAIHAAARERFGDGFNAGTPFAARNSLIARSSSCSAASSACVEVEQFVSATAGDDQLAQAVAPTAASSSGPVASNSRRIVTPSR